MSKSTDWSSKNGFETPLKLRLKDMMSLAEASRNIWLRPDNAADTTISYYVKGALVGFMLDLEIRGKTQNQDSLDDIVLDLDRNFGEKALAYSEEVLLRILNRIPRSDFSDFYSRYILGKENLAINDFLKYAGLELVVTRDDPLPSLGLEVEGTLDNLVRIKKVIPRTSGYKSGLDEDDIILAINQSRVNRDNWKEILNWHKIGEVVEIMLFHGDHILSKSVTIGQEQNLHYSIRELESQSREQNLVRRSLFWEK
jgi:predicted metalloprotease with PDZ domain